MKKVRVIVKRSKSNVKKNTRQKKNREEKNEGKGRGGNKWKERCQFKHRSERDVGMRGKSGGERGSTECIEWKYKNGEGRDSLVEFGDEIVGGHGFAENIHAACHTER